MLFFFVWKILRKLVLDDVIYRLHAFAVEVVLLYADKEKVDGKNRTCYGNDQDEG